MGERISRRLGAAGHLGDPVRDAREECSRYNSLKDSASMLVVLARERLAWVLSAFYFLT